MIIKKRICFESLEVETATSNLTTLVKQDEISDADAIQRARFAIKPRIIEEVIIA